MGAPEWRRERRARWRRHLGGGAVVALAAALVGYGLGASSLHNRDEAVHALVVLELVESGDWLDLTLEGEPYFAKPPLRFWLAAPLVQWFGLNAWTARFWSAAFGVGTVLVLAWGVSCRWGRAAGAWSALALATSHAFLYRHAARSGEIDTTLVFFWSAALLALAEAAARRRPGWLLAAGALAGAAALAKHVLFLPELWAIAALAAAAGVGRRLPARWWAAAAAAGLAVALPWHVATWLRHGEAFLEAYFGAEVAGRISGTAPSSAAGLGPLYYLRELVVGFFPWSLLLPVALPLAARRARRRDPLTVVTLAWALVAIAVPSLARSKLPWYVLPVLPAAAILVGTFVAVWLRRAPRSGVDLAMAAAALLALLSPTNAATHNPFSRDAVFGGHAVDWLGRGSTGGTWSLVACLLLGGAILWVATARHPPPLAAARHVARTGVVALIAVLALWNAGAPLLFAGTQSAADRLLEDMERHRAPAEALHLLIERAYPARYAARLAGAIVLPIEAAGSGDCTEPPPGLLLTTSGRYRDLRAAWRDCGRPWQLLETEPPYVLVRVEAGFPARGRSRPRRYDQGE